MRVAKVIKEDWSTYSVTVRNSAQNYKCFLTKVLEYIAGLNRRIKFVCVATYVLLSDDSLLTCLSRDIIKYTITTH